MIYLIEEEKWNKAKKIPSDQWHDQVFFNDSYYPDLDHILDDYEGDFDELYVFGTKKCKPTFDVRDFFDWFEKQYEFEDGFELSDFCVDLEGLHIFLLSWLDKQPESIYYPDYNISIIPTQEQRETYEWRNE